MTRQQTTHHRAGFTLIELMAVIVIISILIAILLPSINSVRKRAHVAQVSVEIKGLESALSQFQVQFGSYPPSRIVLHEMAAGWASDTRSSSAMRRLCPQFDPAARHHVDPFDTSSPLLPGRDFNGDGDSDDTFTLTGAECLALFTAGRLHNGVPIGLSKNPRDPFELDRGTRIGPFYDFDVTRFTDVDSDGIPEYQDPLSKDRDAPYLYLSAYDGKGYDPDHDADVFPPHAAFTAAVPDTRPDLGIDSNGDGVKDDGRVYYQNAAATESGMVAHKRDTYQIISPGFDGEYGEGGSYTSADGLFRLGATGSKITITDGGDVDNVTNFSSGQLTR